MTKSEKQIPLTTQDFEKLKGRKSGGRGCFLIVFTATLIVSVILFIFMNDTLGTLNIASLPGGVVVLPFTLAFIALFYFIQRRYTGKANKDIRGGMKKVVTTQVQKQFTEDLDPSRRTNFSNTTAFIIDIDVRHYEVNEQDYQKYKEGMWVEVHTALHSGEFLGIYEPTTGKVLTVELL